MTDPHVHEFKEREGSLSEWCACGAARWKGETDEESAAMEGLLGPQTSVGVEYHNAVSPSTWSTKTPTEILADVNALLTSMVEPPALPTYYPMPVFIERRLRNQGPAPGSYWDFGQLLVPWEPWGRLLMREQIVRLMRQYRRVKRTRRPRWAVRA